ACGVDTLGLHGTALHQLNAEVAKKTAVPASEQAVANQWGRWASYQHFQGTRATPDYAHPEQMNRYTWYQTHNWKIPYPGDSTIYAPSQVPGAAIPAPEGDD